MKVTSFIADFLIKKNIDKVFELQGGMITRIIDEIYQQGKIKIVTMHHEQAAAFAADAYARVTNKPGIAIATSGPGATNLITGIGSCYFDSVPAIFITGQVNINEQKGDNPTRQLGFQETDIVSIVKPITKKAYAIKLANEIPHVFEEAYNIAVQGRPGPVLIDIPMNIQNEEIKLVDFDVSNIKKEVNQSGNLFIAKMLSDLKLSNRPIILAGRGIQASGSLNLFRSLLKKFKIPIVTSLLGLDVIEYNNPLRIGFIGTYGNRWANYALGSSDFILVLGSRLDIRQTGIDTDSFMEGKKLYHVDIDDNELNNRFKDCITLNSNLSSFFSELLMSNEKFAASLNWLDEIKIQKNIRSDVQELEKIDGINPNAFIHALSKKSKNAVGYVADVGNNQMWCSQSLELEESQFFITSGGMGAMGYSLPAAIGVSIESKNPVVSISGDGGFQINIQELQTIRRNNLPVKIVVLNNSCLGMIRQFQDSYFDNRYQSTVWDYNAPDFKKIAAAYNINSASITKVNEINDGLEKLWEHPQEPFLLEVIIDIHTNVFPKMMFGSPITKMEPPLAL